jgi:hypothetical protein
VDAYFLVIDDEGFVAAVPSSLSDAERRARDLNLSRLIGAYGQVRRYEVVPVDAKTHDAACRRYVLRLDREVLGTAKLPH